MPRPKRKRLVNRPPIMEGFKPFGIPMTELEPVILFYEELEAIRLLDYDGMTQVEAARSMLVSRPTLTRIYEKARRSIAAALVEGKAIFIEGGDYHTNEFWYRCESCFQLIIGDTIQDRCKYCNSKDLRLLTRAPAQKETEQMQEKGGFCICPDCNIRIPHEEGVPCRERVCQGCGKRMMRENSYHHQLYLKKKGKKDESSSSQ